MNMYDIIHKKREGDRLSRKEIEFFVRGYTTDSIPDYQVAALLMAVHFQGMDREETWLMTDAMCRTGDVADLSSIKGIKVDKHSTGGVGDKTTLIVGPLAAACGVYVAKMSGRGLGFTGGTIDKLESIPGFRTALEIGEFIDLVRKEGLSVVGQSDRIAPADKKIYALRDVTATVDNISLIAASIMSKKLALGSDAIIFDVKCGNGAFMNEYESALDLSRIMVDIGKAAGKKTVALITDMNQPLGFSVGNSLEVIEAIDTLKGFGPSDITELSLRLAGYMVYAGGKADSPEQGRLMAKGSMESGAALKRFKRFIKGQGGNPEIVKDYSLFPKAEHHKEIITEKEGYIAGIECGRIGYASSHTGAGREKKGDSIDLAAGVVLKQKIGGYVHKGETLAVVHGNDKARVERGAEEVADAFTIGKVKPEPTPLIINVIE